MDLTALLSGLGPWGVVAGVVLTIGAQFVRARLAAKIAAAAVPAVPASVPAPTPVVVAPAIPPATVVAPVPVPATVPVTPHTTGTPVIDAVLTFIRSRLQVSAPAPGADIDHETAAGLLSLLFAPRK